MNKRRIYKIAQIFSYIIFFMICERKLGCAGNGILIGAFSIYSLLFITLMGSVLNTLSKMVSVRISRGFFDNAKRVFYYCLLYTAFVSIFVALTFCLFPRGIVRLFLNDSSAELVILMLGIFFIFEAFCTTIGGYYLGCEHQLFYIIGLAIKCILQIILCPLFINLSSSLGQKAANLHKNDFLISIYGSAGAVIALIIADFMMLIILLVGLRLVLQSDSFSFNEVRSKDGFRSFLKSFTMPAINLFKEKIFPSLSIITSICIYCRSSMSTGKSVQMVYSDIGAIGVPVIITIVFALLFYKNFVENYRKRIRADFRKDDKKTMNTRFNFFVLNGVTVIIPVTLIVIIFAPKLSTHLFGCTHDDANGLLVFAGIIILLKGIDMIFAKSLDAISSDSIVLLGRVVGLACAILLMLTADKNGPKINNIMIALTFDILIATIIHGLFTIKTFSLRINDLIAKLIKIIISSVILLIVSLVLSKLVAVNMILLIASIVIAYLIYMISLVLLKGINNKDVQSLSGTLMFYPLSIIKSFLKN